MKTIGFYPNEPQGEIKPLHGVNNAARLTGYGELLPDFCRLRPPFVRLHDAGGPYGGSRYVDVANVFPDFSANENDPASYDFLLTDCYVRPLVELGAEVLYRLGATIEHEPKKYRTVPPADFGKWARVCEHIVRHYNDGWADGFHFNIRHWEIWNEPDGLNPACEPFGCPNWQGTAQQYYELYTLTAKEIKAKHPTVLVGGYSSCYVLGNFRNGGWYPGDVSFFTGFLEYLKAHNAPLDFFSWHGYLGKQYIDKVEVESDFVDQTLTAYGFANALRFDTEWNCNIHESDGENRRTENYINYRNEKGASHCAAALFKMQRCKIDAAMYYDAQLWCAYGALFEVPSLKPTKAWRALKAFGELYDLGTWLKTTDEENIYTCAAGNGQKAALCLANVSERTETVALDCPLVSIAQAQVFVLDKTRDFEKEADGTLPETIALPPYSVVKIELLL